MGYKHAVILGVSCHDWQAPIAICNPASCHSLIYKIAHCPKRLEKCTRKGHIVLCPRGGDACMPDKTAQWSSTSHWQQFIVPCVLVIR